MKRNDRLPFGEGGFSLIELMVVIAIASIMTSILVATFYKGESRETEVYNAAREFGTYAQKYRMQGINENVCYIFSFTNGTGTPSSNKYEIYKNDDCDGVTATSTLIKTVNLSSYKFDVMFGNYGGTTCTSQGVSISGSCALEFYIKPRGFLNVSTDVVIYFTTKEDYDKANKDVQTRARVDSLTGRIDLEKYINNPW